MKPGKKRTHNKGKARKKREAKKDWLKQHVKGPVVAIAVIVLLAAFALKINKGDWVVIGASSYVDTGFHPSINVVSPYKRTQGLQAFRVLGDEKHNRILSVKGENYHGNIGHSLLAFHMKEDPDIYEYLRDFYERRRHR